MKSLHLFHIPPIFPLWSSVISFLSSWHCGSGLSLHFNSTLHFTVLLLSILFTWLNHYNSISSNSINKFWFTKFSYFILSLLTPPSVPLLCFDDNYAEK
jgi:hypothetical protein